MPITPFGILTFSDLDAAVDAAALTPAYLARRLGAAQSVPNATITTLSTDTVEFDNDGLDLFGAFEASRAGLWHARAVVEFAANATGVRTVTLRISATDQPAPVTLPAVATPNPTVVEMARNVELAAGNLIAFRATQNSTVALNVTIRELSVHLIAAA